MKGKGESELGVGELGVGGLGVGELGVGGLGVRELGENVSFAGVVEEFVGVGPGGAVGDARGEAENGASVPEGLGPLRLSGPPPSSPPSPSSPLSPSYSPPARPGVLPLGAFSASPSLVLRPSSSPSLTCIAFPGFVARPARALETLGGPGGLAAGLASRPPKVLVRFSPLDPLCHPLVGRAKDACRVLVRIDRIDSTAPDAREPDRPGQAASASAPAPAPAPAPGGRRYALRVVGFAPRVFAFDAPADFRFLPGGDGRLEARAAARVRQLRRLNEEDEEGEEEVERAHGEGQAQGAGAPGPWGGAGSSSGGSAPAKADVAATPLASSASRRRRARPISDAARGKLTESETWAGMHEGLDPEPLAAAPPVFLVAGGAGGAATGLGVGTGVAPDARKATGRPGAAAAAGAAPRRAGGLRAAWMPGGGVDLVALAEREAKRAKKGPRAGTTTGTTTGATTGATTGTQPKVSAVPEAEEAVAAPRDGRTRLGAEAGPPSGKAPSGELGPGAVAPEASAPPAPDEAAPLAAPSASPRGALSAEQGEG